MRKSSINLETIQKPLQALVNRIFSARGVRRMVMSATCVTLVALVLAGSLPLRAFADTEEAEPKAFVPPPPPVVKVNRTVPAVTPVRTFPSLSTPPTRAEIERVRVFNEKLVWIGDETESTAENSALVGALRVYAEAGESEATEPLEGFLASFPKSGWKASLLMNLGLIHWKTGYFRKALAAWEESWTLAKRETAPEAAGVADQSAAELALMNGRLGRYDRLESLLAELGKRTLRGSTAEKVAAAKVGLWKMNHEPGEAFLCGPFAVGKMAGLVDPARRFDPAIIGMRSTRQGTSLAQLDDLARAAKLEMQPAKRGEGTELVVPAVVHWKAGHFAALVERATIDGKVRYHLQDPTFGDDLWVSGKALDEETSGYFLIADGSLPEGWQPVGRGEAAKVWGKGFTNGEDPDREECKQKGKCGSSCGMAVYNFYWMKAALNVEDTPVGYSPPRGPSVNFEVNYVQRDQNQPATFTYSNLGNKWTFDWLSYVQDDTSAPGQNVSVYLRGGGRQTATGMNTGTGEFTANLYSQAVLKRIPALGTVTSYERRLPNGSKEVFAQSNGAVGVRKMFLTQIIDPQGNALTLTYDAQMRIVSVTDAIGQVTTLTYGLVGDPLKITKVTDPFGRFATFDYNGSGQLVKITDVIGLTSEFTYGASDFVSSLVTPYGTTTFTDGVSPTDPRNRWVTATDPLGQTERVEFRHTAPGIAETEPAGSVPTGMGVLNDSLHYRNTFYWDKKAWADHPGDYTKAHIRHWLHTDGNLTAGVLESEKKPLENRVWYRYLGQTSPAYTTNMVFDKPTQIGRVLDDGTTQKTVFYRTNTFGKATAVFDPVGRLTTYGYAANGVDLTSVIQSVGGGVQTLASYTYNSQHLPLTMTDAALKTTTYTYNAQGQILTSTNAKSETTTHGYDANGYLTSVTGPVAGATTTYTYDGFGRVRTRTNSDGYTVTMDYDAMDRVTKTTFPDGSYQETTYDPVKKLDVQKQRDRQGRITETTYDALRRVTSVKDPQNRTTSFGWCNCGGLATMTDAENHTTTWNYDLQGRLTSKVLHDATQTQYLYETTTSRLKRMTDAKGQFTNFEYFGDNNLKQTSYTNLASGTAPTPTVSFTYDASYNRAVSMTDGIGTTNYTYHPVTAGSGTLGATQLATIDGPLANDTISYGYDELGRVLSRSINGTAQTMTYDSLGRVTNVTNALGSFTPTYDGVTGRLLQMQYPNGVKTNYTYFGNTLDRRMRGMRSTTTTGKLLAQYEYRYELEGDIRNILRWFEGLPTAKTNQAFTYDNADQITGAVLGDGKTANTTYGYAYDLVGNRTSETATGGMVFTNTDTHNTVNQKISRTGTTPTTFTYDLNGNMTGDGVKTYQWDGANRLTKITQGTRTSEFSYDGMSRRVKILEKDGAATLSDNRYLWCSESQPCEERDSTGGIVTKRYFGQGVQEGATNYFYQRDHLGCINVLTDQTAAVTATYDYDPWGRTAQLQGTKKIDFGYAGYWKHEPSGLNLTWYRAYDPNLGRWLSRDPIEEKDGPNLYVYVQNETITALDPNGLAALCFDEKCKKCDGRLPEDENSYPNDPSAYSMFPSKPGNCYDADAFCSPWGLIKIPDNCICTVICDGQGETKQVNCACTISPLVGLADAFGKATSPRWANSDGKEFPKGCKDKPARAQGMLPDRLFPQRGLMIVFYTFSG